VKRDRPGHGLRNASGFHDVKPLPLAAFVLCEAVGTLPQYVRLAHPTFTRYKKDRLRRTMI